MNIATKEAGIQYVPMDGMREELSQMSSVAVWDIHLVCSWYVLATTVNKLMFSESIVANYGRGSSPILPYRVQCAADDHDLSTCIKEETDVSQCKYVAGVDCAGKCLF